MPGPIPNRSDDVSRERDVNRGDRTPMKHGEMMPVSVPNAGKDWHPIAKKLWQSLKTSGQAQWFQNSDWAYAYFVMEEVTLHMQAGKHSAMRLTAIDSMLSKLLVTEGDRRRARIELTSPEEDTGPSVGQKAVTDYKSRLGLIDGGKKD